MLPPMELIFRKDVQIGKDGVEVYGYLFVEHRNVLDAISIGDALAEYALGPYVYSVGDMCVIINNADNGRYFILEPGDFISQHEFRILKKIVHNAGTRLGQIRRRMAWTGTTEIVE